VEVTREPLGVIGLITPWNFPIAIPAWKIAPALAYGNCVVFKPADLVPGCAWALADIIHRSGIPAGVFNLVMGRGSEIGDALVNHPGITAISFTGSVGVGQRIARACAANMKKMQLEMGGKNPQVVLDDADLAAAVELSVQSVQPPHRHRQNLPRVHRRYAKAHGRHPGRRCATGWYRYRPRGVAGAAGARLVVCRNRQGRGRDGVGGWRASDPRHRGLLHGPCTAGRQHADHAH
jgi:hypothetical protein